MRDIKFRAFIDGKMKYYSCNNITLLMQYTGLKDSKGREIYEGDIVELVGFWKLEVKWEELKDDELGEYTTGYGYNSQYEAGVIIGNIHENSDLLGGDKQ